jgi:hypothetical protein
MTQTAMMTPESPQQRLRALERANVVRLARAALKRRIADGDISVGDVILAPPESVKNWSVGDLLLSQRRWGTARCRKFLQRNGITETKLICTLTERQQRLLAAQLETCAPREEETCTPREEETCVSREEALVPA